MKKLMLTFCIFLVTLISFGADIDEGGDSQEVDAVGTVIDRIDIFLVTGYESLDMGIMEANDNDTIYTTADSDRGGNPHPAKVRIEGSVDSTYGGAIVNMYVTDGTETGTANQVTISNATDSIVVVLSYSDSDENTLSSLLQLQLDEDGEKEITLNGKVDAKGATKDPIPSTIGLYEGTIYVRVNYDSSTPWF